MDVVVAAFGSYIRRNSTMPTPADIVNIIDPPRPKPDWAAYVGIKQDMRDPYKFVTDARRAYVAYCENYCVDQVVSYDQRQEAREQLAEAQQKLQTASSEDDDYDHSI